MCKNKEKMQRKISILSFPLQSVDLFQSTVKAYDTFQLELSNIENHSNFLLHVYVVTIS